MKTELQINFVDYLRKEGQRLSTYNGNSSRAGRFLDWLAEEQINYLEVSYSDILSYIKHLKEKGNRDTTINSILNTIRHFYNYLQKENKVQANPAEALTIRNISRRVPHDLLEWEELEQLYKDFKTVGIAGKRNKIILSLIIYQGITTGEITAIELKDVNLEEGKIYIPKVGRSNSRTMQLEAFQVLQIQKYITQVRPVILALAEKESEKLFISIGKGNRMSNSYIKFLKQIKKLNPKVKDFKQIRASIITHWLKNYNIRQVQYMTGHRYISSTEVYRTDTLESLQEMIEELHPLK
jgi:integrase/recombinase XerD